MTENFAAIDGVRTDAFTNPALWRVMQSEGGPLNSTGSFANAHFENHDYEYLCNGYGYKWLQGSKCALLVHKLPQCIHCPKCRLRLSPYYIGFIKANNIGPVLSMLQEKIPFNTDAAKVIVSSKNTDCIELLFRNGCDPNDVEDEIINTCSPKIVDMAIEHGLTIDQEMYARCLEKKNYVSAMKIHRVLVSLGM